MGKDLKTPNEPLDLSTTEKEFYEKEFTHYNSSVSRGELESLPCPFCTNGVSDETMQTIIEETDMETKERLKLPLDSSLDFSNGEDDETEDRNDKTSEVWWEELERAVNAHNIPYYEDMYDIEELISCNGSYHRQHGVIQSDVDKINDHISWIEKTRSFTEPKVGDIIRYTDKYGNHYPTAHLDKINEKGCYICEQPFFPFIGKTESGISCVTSGGAWQYIPTEQLKYLVSEYKYFKDWGHRGCCGDGAISFKATVNVWTYVDSEPVLKRS